MLPAHELDQNAISGMMLTETEAALEELAKHRAKIATVEKMLRTRAAFHTAKYLVIIQIGGEKFLHGASDAYSVELDRFQICLLPGEGVERKDVIEVEFRIEGNDVLQYHVEPNQCVKFSRTTEGETVEYAIRTFSDRTVAMAHMNEIY